MGSGQSRARVRAHRQQPEWTRITGEPLPATPVDVHSYIAAGLPWFDLYDDHLGDIEPSGALAKVTSVDEVVDGVW